MPWKETDVVKERVKFVLEWEKQWQANEGEVNVSALCAAFGISRETGHCWIRRYRDADHDIASLQSRSRRPHSSPSAIDAQVEVWIVVARRKFPKWGARKLKVHLEEQHPGQPFPAPSTIGSILDRHALSRPRKIRRAKVPPYTQPFAECTAPNMLWCVDFKGHFKTGNGERVYPLTITDAFSRYLIRCSIVPNPDGAQVKRVFESAFREFGRPAAIRSDNGSPFASKAAGGLSWLSAWWICLDIMPERIEPGHPEQNGRHERMHRTLKEHTAIPPKSSPASQQRAFDRFMREYNYLRPHEALDMKTPASVFRSSDRVFPIPMSSPPQQTMEVALVGADGKISLGRRKSVFIASCLAGLRIGLDYASTRLLEVSFGPIHLGFIDLDAQNHGLIQPKHRRYKACHNAKQAYESGKAAGAPPPDPAEEDKFMFV